MIDGMRRYLNKEIFIDGCHANIINALTCYEGDYSYLEKTGTQKRYSASDADFMKSLPYLNKPPQS